MDKVSSIKVFVKKRDEDKWAEHNIEVDVDEDEDVGVEDAERWAREHAFDLADVDCEEIVDVKVARVYREGSIKKQKEIVTVEV